MQRLAINNPQGASWLYVPDGHCELDLASLGRPELAVPTAIVSVVSRPWGMWEELVQDGNCTVRILTCNRGQRLSDQRHRERDEFFYILDPETLIELDGEMISATPRDCVFIPRMVWHRLACGKADAVRVLEIAFGRYDQANDIERRSDDYGRPLRGPGIGAV